MKRFKRNRGLDPELPGAFQESGGKKLPGAVKTALWATVIGAAYLAGIVVLLWPSVEAVGSP